MKKTDIGEMSSSRPLTDFKDNPSSSPETIDLETAASSPIKANKKHLEPDQHDAYQGMRSATVNQLALMAHCASTLDALQRLIDIIAKEQQGYAADATPEQEKLKRSIEGLIVRSKDLMAKLPDSDSPTQDRHQLARIRQELQKKLALWMPAYYLINKHLPDEMHKLPDNDDTCDFCRVLGDMRSQSERYMDNRNKVANKHLMLVHSISNKYRYLGLPYEDLFQEGFIGLIKAVERYQPDKGFQFSTYAHRVIGQAIHLALDKQTHLVRKPYRVLREKASVDQIRKKTEQELGRALRSFELEEKLPNNLEDKQSHLDDNIGFTADSESLWTINPRAFDVATKDIADEQMKLQVLCESEHLDRAISELDQRSQEILRMRFGLGINRAHTLAEISENLSLSSERVRQIVIKAVETLSIKFQPN